MLLVFGQPFVVQPLFQVGHTDGSNSHYVGDWTIVLGANSLDNGMIVSERLDLACGF